jgi:transcription-repair coupling factor (superfamily II helicase)
MRLVLYKRIASAIDDMATRDLQVELIDRFGILPDAVKNLFAINGLKRKARAIGISKISANDSGGRIVFLDQPDIDPMVVINLIQQAPQTYQFDGKNTLRFSIETAYAEERIRCIGQLLEALTAKKAA